MVGACTITSEESYELVGAGLDMAVVGVEMLHGGGVDALNASDNTIKLVATVCVYLETGSPVVVTAINIVVARLNDGVIDPVTVAEFTNGLTKACQLIEAVLKPSVDA